MIDQITTTVFLFAFFAVLFLLIRKPAIGYLNSLSEKMIEKNLRLLEEKSRGILKEERERLMELNDERMKRNEQYLDNKKDLIKEMIEKIDDELNKSQKRIENAEKERISEFSNLKAILNENRNITERLKESTDNLKNILSNNQFRGKYGEEVAENILKMLGFVKGLDYVVNMAQETNANRPDITVKLPDGTKINIDAKFPFKSLIKYQESESVLEKKKYIDEFKSHVKQKIKQVTSRDYINPEEKTVDFVILFVPNEMIFSFICDKLNKTSNEAMKKKVIIVGPFSFAAISRMIRQSYESFRIQEDLHRVVNLIRKFKQEFLKYNDEFDKLENRIRLLSDQYNNVKGVRTRQLFRIVDQISGKDSDVIEKKSMDS